MRPALYRARLLLVKIIGKNVTIGHYCNIEFDVVIGDNTVIKSYVELLGKAP